MKLIKTKVWSTPRNDSRVAVNAVSDIWVCVGWETKERIVHEILRHGVEGVGFDMIF